MKGNTIKKPKKKRPIVEKRWWYEPVKDFLSVALTTLATLFIKKKIK